MSNTTRQDHLAAFTQTFRALSADVFVLLVLTRLAVAAPCGVSRTGFRPMLEAQCHELSALFTEIAHQTKRLGGECPASLAAVGRLQRISYDAASPATIPQLRELNLLFLEMLMETEDLALDFDDCIGAGLCHSWIARTERRIEDLSSLLS